MKKKTNYQLRVGLAWLFNQAPLVFLYDTLQGMLNSLSDMEVEDLTTFELNFLKAFAENPPKQRRGAEEKILG